MRSSFSSRRRSAPANKQTTLDENYDLKGLNLVAPDQVMPPGETPFAVNCRRYADNSQETAVAIRTRQGSTMFSTPVGEAVNVEVDATATGDIDITPETIVAIPFTADGAGALTKATLRVKKVNSTRGYLIVQVYTSFLDLPGRPIATSSAAPSIIGSSYADISLRFMDAPALNDGDDYFLVVKMQTLGAGVYQLEKVGTGAIRLSTDNQDTWTVTDYGANFSVSTSEAGFIKGFHKRYPEDQDALTLFAMGTSVYKVPNSPATPEFLDEGAVSASSEIVRFFSIDQRTFWTDGENPARWYNGVDAPEAVPNIPNANGVPVLGMIFENRALWVPKGDRTRIDFSALYDFETYPEVNFLYIGRPSSRDWITSMHQFREAATIFTKETKYTLTGTDIKTFQPIPHIGTKGAISHEATAVGVDAIYFMADDRNIYAWNGSKDILISKKVRPELKKILDLDKVRFHLYNNQLRVYYNRNPDSDVTNMLLFDIEEGQWYRDTGRAVMGSMEWTFDDNELVEFSSKCGWIFFGERNYSDLGKPISFKYWTAYKPYGSGAAKDRIKKFRPVVRPAASSYYMQVGKDIDFNNTPVMRPWLVDSGGAPWGSFNWGDGTVFGGARLVDNASAMSGRGKLTQFRFEHDGIEQPVFLVGYIAIVKVGRPR